MKHRTPEHPVRGIVFDLDGTLTVPMLDFAQIRRDIGMAEETMAILEFLETLPDDERRRRYEILLRHEAEAAERSTLSAGVRELWQFFQRKAMKTGLVTRNSIESVHLFRRRHDIHFDAVVTRELAPPKPSPVPLLMAVELMNLEPHDVVYVGDFEMDRLTGEAAGILTYIVRHHADIKDGGPDDLRIERLLDLIPIIGGGSEE